MAESRFFCPFCGNRLTIAAANAEEYEVWCENKECPDAPVEDGVKNHIIMEEIWDASQDAGYGLCEEWAEQRPDLKVRFP